MTSPSRLARALAPVLALGLALACGALLVARSAAAQRVVPSSVPFAPGVYERWSPLFDAPSGGPLAAPPTALPEWIRVEVAGDFALVILEPEARVRWRIRYGAHGSEEKRVAVDGTEVLRAVYERDAAGALVRKVVSGNLAPAGLAYAYTTDAQGRVLTRERTTDGGIERLEVRWAPSGGATAIVSIGGVERRRDLLDSSGRLLETTWGHDVIEIGPDGARRTRREEARLVYRRRRDGGLRSVVRTRRGRSGPAQHAVRDTSVASADLSVVAGAPIERGEARLLLGSPATAVDRERGAARELSDDYADGCWMNETNYLAYDATGLLESAGSGCICGFCVDASLPWAAEDVVGTELHWSAGPWIRLDGELVVTPEHEIVTPDGPRASGTLRAGDLVMGSDGAPRALRTVERLGEGMRLGRNVETEAGTFVVGRFVVVSERYPQACEPDRGSPALTGTIPSR